MAMAASYGPWQIRYHTDRLCLEGLPGSEYAGMTSARITAPLLLAEPGEPVRNVTAFDEDGNAFHVPLAVCRRSSYALTECYVVGEFTRTLPPTLPPRPSGPRETES